ncbi:hypothetical protein Q9L42_020895 (plasmid) [Methylomarinum sp. Ch1-1]|uniref:Uncharacterized protein n=1 Tax=Methylomarinum roseum TaxID=3067653 RepID=A0AAU7P0J0_9GAMM|nr:hypothetical protein [Methylomarinum sp. Ch1-1]MDP4518981.1 hypothetical protein [Methylomarinum sp. Ch1-1]MDP4523379.1 hypothetical protein [Methylomarinum sp. Ch1-1]
MDYIGGRYGLEVIVKEPSAFRSEPEHRELKVDKWQISVITAPQRKDVPRQKIKIEVVNIPAYSREPRPLQVNYSFLPAGTDSKIKLRIDTQFFKNYIILLLNY